MVFLRRWIKTFFILWKSFWLKKSWHSVNALEGNAFFLFLVCFIASSCSWKFDTKQGSCMKSIHLVTYDVLYNQSAFYKVKTVFSSLLWIMGNLPNINGLSNSWFEVSNLCFNIFFNIYVNFFCLYVYYKAICIRVTV